MWGITLEPIVFNTGIFKVIVFKAFKGFKTIVFTPGVVFICINCTTTTICISWGSCIVTPCSLFHAENCGGRAKPCVSQVDQSSERRLSGGCQSSQTPDENPRQKRVKNDISDHWPNLSSSAGIWT